MYSYTGVYSSFLPAGVPCACAYSSNCCGLLLCLCSLLGLQGEGWPWGGCSGVWDWVADWFLEGQSPMGGGTAWRQVSHLFAPGLDCITHTANFYFSCSVEGLAFVFKYKFFIKKAKLGLSISVDLMMLAFLQNVRISFSRNSSGIGIESRFAAFDTVGPH